MKKLLVITTVVVLCGVGCMKAQIKAPITLADGTHTEITASISRPPFAKGSITYNTTTGTMSIEANTSTDFNQALQQAASIAALAGSMYKTPTPTPTP